VRKILREEPAIYFADYDLTFEHKDGKWQFKKGTLCHRLTEAYISSGRKPNEIEPERTESFDSLTSETLQFLFYGKGQGQEKRKEKTERSERITLQYLVASSKFVAVSGKGTSSPPLHLIWDLSRMADKEKKEFDDLITQMDQQGIEGVQFECHVPPT
jgi:hypothetical protein